MSLNRRKLKEWVTRRSLTPPVAERFALYHQSRGGPNIVLNLIADGSGEQLADGIERQVREESKDHVEAYAGRQQYLVRAFDEHNAQLGEYPFALTASRTVTDAASALALPTPDQDDVFNGQAPEQFSSPYAMLLNQQMRHNEAMVRYVVEMSMAKGERDCQIITKQNEHIDRLEGRRIEYIELIEGMYSERDERTLKLKRYETDQARKEKLLGTITNFVLPEMARRGGIPLGDGLTELKQLFFRLPKKLQDEVVASLPPDDAEKMIELLVGKQSPEGAPTTTH